MNNKVGLAALLRVTPKMAAQNFLVWLEVIRPGSKRIPTEKGPTIETGRARLVSNQQDLTVTNVKTSD